MILHILMALGAGWLQGHQPQVITSLVLLETAADSVPIKITP